MKNNQEPGFRHELKFLLSKTESEIFKKRLDILLSRDLHADNGVYMIRSLYFDDRDESAYFEKMSGIESRKKYRIRFYNGNDDVIRLERKRKEGQYIQKVSAKLTRQEVDQILVGQYDFLRFRKEKLCQDFYMECMVKGMRPAVIVDYEREPFVYPYGDVRITFDSSIRAGLYEHTPFDMDMPVVEAIDRDKLILEVKYTEYLPEMIRDILPIADSVQVAFSKYTMCLEKKKELSGVLE